MQITRYSGLGVLALVLALSVPAPVQASFINIDESVEGATPTATISSDLNGIISVSITPQPQTVGEEWAIQISTTGSFTSETDNTFQLLEPGSSSLSDSLDFSSIVGTTTATYFLFSDNNAGGIAADKCTNGVAGCFVVAEDGTFQNTDQEVDLVSGNTIFNVPIFLKSDVEVPEPASGALLAAALGALLVMCRRPQKGRKLSQQQLSARRERTPPP